MSRRVLRLLGTYHRLSFCKIADRHPGIRQILSHAKIHTDSRNSGTNMANGATRWGIVSAGSISNDFVCALNMLSKDKHTITAIAARDGERAEQFAKYHDIPRFYDSYAAIASDPDIDVVYIATLQLTHLEIAKLMIDAGKPVLCEKPLTLNSKENKELLSYAKDKGVFLMEGYWTRLFPAYNKMLEEIRKGTIGEPRIITLTMGYVGKVVPGDWKVDAKTGGGVITGLGGYAVSLAQSVFGEAPKRVVASADLSEQGADLTSNLILHYGDHRMVIATIAHTCKLKNTATIHGTEGIIELGIPWCPTEVTVLGETFHYPLPERSDKMLGMNRPGFMYEAEHVREMLLKGALESPVIPHSVSLYIMEVLDEARRQLGVTYVTDS